MSSFSVKFLRLRGSANSGRGGMAVEIKSNRSTTSRCSVSCTV
ncbi:hypothetical protein PR001_g12158 [Phytophthora rubi]|uniref:Uncharacterized protein n=1 Tax=Phytophthora rubi TaxID=129364 RepID=A0A6A3M8D4_9STRA|nr:hypothetical protein PR001_g12158 [Phytophthora rubi]